jgi:hypothetical protein
MTSENTNEERESAKHNVVISPLITDLNSEGSDVPQIRPLPNSDKHAAFATVIHIAAPRIGVELEREILVHTRWSSKLC